MAGGGSIGFNNSVFLAEREQADRNFALSYQLKAIFTYSTLLMQFSQMQEHGCFPEGTNIKDCLDLWYQCCSMEESLEATYKDRLTLSSFR